MRFYYFSTLSWIAYGVAVVIAITLLSLLWTKVLKLKVRNPFYWVLFVAVLVLPWAEELWIAYNFDRLCTKDAGVFVNRTVQVDGYYDGRRPIARIVGEPLYKFIESPDGKGKYRRVEHATAEEKANAIASYVRRNNGRQPGEKEWITDRLDDKREIVVEMNTSYAWRFTALDKPLARYQYKPLDNYAPVAHQIRRFEDVVIDTATSEVLGRYTNYTRGPYWFFIHLGAPTIECRELEGQDPLVNRAVLKFAK